MKRKKDRKFVLSQKRVHQIRFQFANNRVSQAC